MNMRYKCRPIIYNKCVIVVQNHVAQIVVARNLALVLQNDVTHVAKNIIVRNRLNARTVKMGNRVHEDRKVKMEIKEKREIKEIAVLKVVLEKMANGANGDYEDTRVSKEKRAKRAI